MAYFTQVLLSVEDFDFLSDHVDVGLQNSRDFRKKIIIMAYILLEKYFKHHTLAGS